MTPTYTDIDIATDDTATDTIQVTATLSTLSDVTVVLWIGWRDDTQSGGSPGTVSTVDTNGNGTEVYKGRGQRNAVGDNYVTLEAWIIEGMTNVSMTVDITLTEAVDVSDGIIAALVEYTGAGNGVEAGNITPGTGDDVDDSLTLTTVSSDSLVVAAFGHYGGITVTADNTENERADQDIGQTSMWVIDDGSDGAEQTVSGTHFPVNVDWGGVAMELKEAAAGVREVSETDGVTVGESVTMQMGDHAVGESDGLTIGESVNMQVSAADLNVNMGADNVNNWKQGVRIHP